MQSGMENGIKQEHQSNEFPLPLCAGCKRLWNANKEAVDEERLAALRFDGIPQKSRNVRAAKFLHLSDTGWRGDVNLRHVIADHVDADEDEATLAQGGPDPRTDLAVASGQFYSFRPATDMHVGPAVGFCRNPVDGADRLPIDEQDALVALAYGGEIGLGNIGLVAIHLLEHFQQRGEVAVV